MAEQTDRELLEGAAKSAGLEVYVWGTAGSENFAVMNAEPTYRWNPLTDDAAALRLAVKLGLDIIQHSKLKDGRLEVAVFAGENLELEPYGADPYAATRRAITRAAAAIGAQHKGGEK